MTDFHAPGKTHFFFTSEFSESEKFYEEDLIRLYPYGLSLGTDPNRPTLLLRDDKGEHTLPVSINPLEAGATLSQSHRQGVPHTPHKVTELILQSLNITVTKCVFVEIKNHNQYVKFFLSNHPSGQKTLKVRADEAMSLCLHLNIGIYATREFMNRSKVLNAEIEGLSKGVMMNPEILQKGQGYIQ